MAALPPPYVPGSPPVVAFTVFENDEDECDDCEDSEFGICDYHLGWQDGWDAASAIMRRNS